MMGWVRNRRRFGGWLALFALALQLALSFGHIHPEDFAAANPAGVAAAHSGSVPSAPVGDHDDCPICAAIHLAGTLLLPAPPAIPLAVIPAFTRIDAPAPSEPAPAPAQFFQARGPPEA
jgi:hypothetical protein